MRAIVQRVSEAAVEVDGEPIAKIGPGLLVLLGVRRGDTTERADRLVAKLLALRVFEDGDGRMNLNVGQAGGEVLCVSQFTLRGHPQRQPPELHRSSPARRSSPPLPAGP